MSRLSSAHNFKILRRAMFAARYCIFVISFGLGSVALQAQSNAPSISSQSTKQPSGVLDGDIVVPNATRALGQQDAAALSEIMGHGSVVGAAPWQGMQGTGQIVYGAKDSTAYPATLSILGINQFRLDAQTPKGEMSLRIHGPVGKIQGNGEPPETIPPDTASAGLFPFALVRAIHIGGRTTSLIDQGLTTVGDVQLHRVTVEIPSIGHDPALKSRRMVPIDFYFDPASHLLIKSASSSPNALGLDTKFLHVVTYSDYRRVGTSMIPFRYEENVNGQRYWVLQLSDVQLNPSLDATYFQF